MSNWSFSGKSPVMCGHVEDNRAYSAPSASFSTSAAMPWADDKDFSQHARSPLNIFLRCLSGLHQQRRMVNVCVDTSSPASTCVHMLERHALWKREATARLNGFLCASKRYWSGEYGFNKVHAQGPCAELILRCNSGGLLKSRHSMGHVTPFHSF